MAKKNSRSRDGKTRSVAKPTAAEQQYLEARLQELAKPTVKPTTSAAEQQYWEARLARTMDDDGNQDFWNAEAGRYEPPLGNINAAKKELARRVPVVAAARQAMEARAASVAAEEELLDIARSDARLARGRVGAAVPDSKEFSKASGDLQEAEKKVAEHEQRLVIFRAGAKQAWEAYAEVANRGYKLTRAKLDAIRNAPSLPNPTMEVDTLLTRAIDLLENQRSALVWEQEQGKLVVKPSPSKAAFIELLDSVRFLICRSDVMARANDPDAYIAEIREIAERLIVVGSGRGKTQDSKRHLAVDKLFEIALPFLERKAQGPREPPRLDEELAPREERIRLDSIAMVLDEEWECNRTLSCPQRAAAVLFDQMPDRLGHEFFRLTPQIVGPPRLRPLASDTVSRRRKLIEKCGRDREVAGVARPQAWDIEDVFVEAAKARGYPSKKVRDLIHYRDPDHLDRQEDRKAALRAQTAARRSKRGK